jgi:hypothetical protein
MYELLLLIGGIGFLAMAALGMVHGGGGARGHGHVGGHGHAVGHGHAHTGKGFHVPKALKGGAGVKSRASGLLTLLSPMDLFAFAMGAGAAGTLLKGILSPPLLVWAALAGAFVVDFLVVKPLFGLAMKFVTKPSEGIEGSVHVTAQALTRFDAQGKGLVQFTMDGQIVQLLAKLDPAEVELGEGVGKGDDVTVVEVDSKRNTCVVSRLLRNPQ